MDETSQILDANSIWTLDVASTGWSPWKIEWLKHHNVSYRGRIQGGGDINTALGLLPDKLKTELALHVNLSVLKKVRPTSFGLIL